MRTLYLVEGFGVSPVVTLCVLKDAGGTNLDAVARQLVSQGLHCILVLLDRQQGQRSRHGGSKQTFKGNDRKYIMCITYRILRKKKGAAGVESPIGHDPVIQVHNWSLYIQGAIKQTWGEMIRWKNWWFILKVQCDISYPLNPPALILSRERQEFNRGAGGLKPGGLDGVERGKCFMTGGGTVQVQVEGCTGPEVG